MTSFANDMFLQKRVMQNDKHLLPQVSRYTCAEVICDCADKLLMSCVYLSIYDSPGVGHCFFDVLLFVM